MGNKDKEKITDEEWEEFVEFIKNVEKRKIVCYIHYIKELLTKMLRIKKSKKNGEQS